MAALGAVVQHFITFPGSACQFYWRHLESFGVQKWGTPIFGLTPLVGSAGPLGPPFHRSVGVKVTE